MIKEVKNILINAGWSELRRISKNIVVDQLTFEGYPVLDNVVETMQNLGGLVIKFSNKRNGLKDDDINFDFDHATGLEVPDRIFNNYMPRVKKQLVLIGTAYRDHFVLMMADDNSIYGGYDDYLCKIGNTPTDAIENIILDKDFDEIP
ncbi:SUKH-3 domain-containing protein [Lacibacter sp. H407]|uniref:SUKH-3 domain-containing protein n=1 Tax=Lacibacter sp. H407 TaxID=3133423 RepID=UPI0030BFC43A